MNKKVKKKNVLFGSLFLGVFIFMNFLTSDNLFTIIDVMEKEVGLVTNDVTEIYLTKVSSEGNNYTLTGTDIDKMMVYLNTTYIEKSKRKIHTIDSPKYNIVLYTDESPYYFGRPSKQFMIKQDSDKTYFQLFGEDVEKIITYETEDNDLYDLVLSYLK